MATQSEPNTAGQELFRAKGGGTSGYRAVREYCYRWTCACGRKNRVGEIIAGCSNVCRWCGVAAKIVEISYDNGCISRIG